jgi:tRNA threonylcarbamoyladenosine biosynthesis protein TsaB
MAKILLIETSGEVCSAAISVDGRVVALVEAPDTQSHAALLTLQIGECSNKAVVPLAELDAVAVSKGPGAYTSLRVGASVAKGICFALDKPLIAVDTLLALAHASRSWMGKMQSGNLPTVAPIYVPMLDARRQEVWLAIYNEDLVEIAPPQPLILDNNSFEKFVFEKTGGAQIKWIVLSGNGMEKTRSGDNFKKSVFSEQGKSSASYLADLAEQYFQSADFQDIAYFEPYYMKPPNITTSSKPLF